MKQKPIFIAALLTGLFVSLTLAGSLFAGTATPGQPNGAAHDGNDRLQPGLTFQDEAAAWAADVAILAEESGLPIEQVEQAMRAQQEFGDFADELLSRYPDLIANLWMEPLPGTKGHVQFVGTVPAELAQTLDKEGQNDVAIVTGGGMITLKDQYLRAELAADSLMSLEYNNSLSFFAPMAGTIQLEVKVPPGANQPAVAEIVTTLQNKVANTGLQGRAATFEADDLSLTVIVGEGPIATLTHSRGGEWILRNNAYHCTSGWAVSGSNGDGIMTAGHCSANQFLETNCCIYGMSFVRQEFGNNGDVEYLTTEHIELDDFYANESTIRDVSGTRSTGSMVGNIVCKYGRSSNTRTCNHTVEAINVTVNYAEGTVRSLARTNNDSLIGGDSGGGWSWNTTAWGITSGHGGGKSYYTPVRIGESALGVTVLR